MGYISNACCWVIGNTDLDLKIVIGRVEVMLIRVWVMVIAGISEPVGGIISNVNHWDINHANRWDISNADWGA